MSIQIRFVGGPADGRTLAIPNETPPLLYFIPIESSVADLLTSSLEPSPIRKAEYEPQFEGGLFRVADDGAYLYRHRAAPLAAEQRDALAEGRQKVKAAEEQREAEMDEGWREIRKERPNFPEDWRDLF